MEKKALGTHDIAKVCHVTPPTVGRWIEEGKIPSFSTAGGHRRVWDTDVAAFLESLHMPVPPDLLGGEALRFLIVDDETEVRRFLARALKREYPDAEIHEASDGFEAGHKVASIRPALVILDVQLPGVKGDQVCRTLRADGSLRHVKILAISGHDVEETRGRMLKAGADDFLGKPFTPDELARRVGKWFPATARSAVAGKG